MTTEVDKGKDTPEVLDPATPVNVDDSLEVKVEDSLGETKEETKTDKTDPVQPDQGGDPDESTPPEKGDETTTPEPVDLSNENQQVAELVEEAGITPAELRATMEANGGKVPVVAMKEFVKKHGEGVAAVIAERLGEMYKVGQDAATAANNTLYKEFEGQFEGAQEGSGEQHFANAKKWAQENMSKDERAGITELLQSNSKMVRDLGVQKLASAYQNADSYTQAADLVQGDNLTTNQVQGMSKEAYQQEVQALMDKGFSYESQEVKALQNRRQAAMRRGQ